VRASLVSSSLPGCEIVNFLSRHYLKMSAELSAAAVVLKHPATAVEDINNVLKSMLFHSKPG